MSLLEKAKKLLKTTIKVAVVVCTALAGIALWQGWSLDDIKEKLKGLYL